MLLETERGVPVEDGTFCRSALAGALSLSSLLILRAGRWCRNPIQAICSPSAHNALLYNPAICILVVYPLPVEDGLWLGVFGNSGPRSMILSLGGFSVVWSGARCTVGCHSRMSLQCRA